MHPMPRRLFTEEEYLAIERASEFRSEYLDGEIYAMSGARRPHCLIASNLSGLFYNQFRGRPCEFYVNDMRVRVDDGRLYAYPDLVALCGEARMLDDHGDNLLNPQLIIEILSPSTASFDEGEKGNRYRQLESLTDYLLVHQKQMLVRHWSRQEKHRWVVVDYEQPTDQVHMEALRVVIKLSDIYERVVFPPPDTLPAHPFRILN